MLHPIITLLDGTEVYVNLINNSVVAQSIAKQPQLLGLIKDALRGREFSKPTVLIEQDMERVVGYDFVVETKEDDTIFYAMLLHETTYTRFVKNGKPLSTRYVTLQLERSTDGLTYELRSAHIGRAVPPRPGEANETAKSKAFWAGHAVVRESEVLQLKTICKDSPY